MGKAGIPSTVGGLGVGSIKNDHSEQESSPHLNEHDFDSSVLAIIHRLWHQIYSIEGVWIE